MSDDGPIEMPVLWKYRITNYAHRSEPDRAVSWVRCSVAGQPGRVVRLAAQDPAAGPGTWTAQVGTRPEYGPDFCELGPLPVGAYTLSVDDLDLSVTLWLDGDASAVVSFFPADLGISETEDNVPHVLLLGQDMTNRPNFLALTRYVARFDAVVTFDVDEAARAEHAILVGSTHLVSQATEDQLRDAGVRVERVAGDIAAQLDRAVEAGTPFLAP